MSRILWVSNPTWSPSGYGEQAALFVPRLKALGHEMAVMANWGLQGARQTSDDDFLHYPSDGDWGNSTLSTYAEDHKADLVIILHDAWVYRPTEWEDGPPVAIWAPIDRNPIPPLVLAVLKHQRIRPIAMSRNGEQLMCEAGLDPCYVPHGINTGLFCPRPEVKQQARDILQIPHDAFLVGMVAANHSVRPSRKAFPEAFRAFAQFARDHDDAWMYVHTSPKMLGKGGLDLDVIAMAFATPEGRLRFPPDSARARGIGRDIMAVIYQAFDVLLNPSMGEGFGIPILEAQACGVPVIASDHSAMTELTQAGWLVSGQPYWDEIAGADFVIPSVDAIRAALEAAYESRDDQNLRAAAVQFAQQYDADRVTAEFWEPTLDALQQPREVAPLAAASNGMNRAERRRRAKAGVS